VVGLHFPVLIELSRCGINASEATHNPLTFGFTYQDNGVKCLGLSLHHLYSISVIDNKLSIPVKPHLQLINSHVILHSPLRQ
jgi:hypothetical protein